MSFEAVINVNFLQNMQRSLMMIARATKGRLVLAELESEAWLSALSIGERRNRAIDFSDPEDADFILRVLYTKFVKRADYKFERAKRIDAAQENEDGSHWAYEIPEQVSSDPLQTTIHLEEFLEREALLENSYSEAKAYVVTFNYFNHDNDEISDYFYITSGTLNNRFNRSILVLEHQPSLFDGVEKIDESFIPLRGQERVKQGICIQDTQWAWQF